LGLEVVLFLAAGVLISLADRGYIRDDFLDCALAFIGQMSLLYLMRLSLRQIRFVALMGAFLGMLVAHFASASITEVFVFVAPLYLSLGVVLLWVFRLKDRGCLDSIQASWVALVIVALGLTTFARGGGVLQARFQEESFMRFLRDARMDYAPWLALAGLSATLATHSSFRAARGGISVRDDYYSEARITLRSSTELNDVPPFFGPLVVVWRVFVRVVVSFYNALISTLNFVTRCVMFVKGITQAFVVTFVRELEGTIQEVVSFVFWSAVRVAAPFFAISSILFVVDGAREHVRTHLFSPTIDSTKDVLWMGLQVAIAMLVAVLCFARVAARQIIETYLRDLAALLGYAIPLLMMSSLALMLTTMAVKRAWDVDLRFHFSYLSWGCLCAVGLGALLVWVTRMRAVLHRRGGQSQ